MTRFLLAFVGFILILMATLGMKHISISWLFSQSSAVTLLATLVACILALGPNRTFAMFSGNDRGAALVTTSALAAVSIISFFLGQMVFLQNLQNPDVLVPAFNAALISPIYGITVSGVLLLLNQKFDTRLEESSTLQAMPRSSFFVLFAGIVFVTLLKGVPLGSLISVSCATLILGGLLVGMSRTGIAGFIAAIQGKDKENAQTLVSFTTFTGFLSMILGAMTVSVNLRNPDAIGPGLAIVLVGAIYSLFVIAYLTIANRLCAGLRSVLIFGGGAVVMSILGLSVAYIKVVALTA